MRLMVPARRESLVQARSTLPAKPAIALGLIFIFLLAAYLPALHASYLHTDDYFYSRWSHFSRSSIVVFGSILGKPLAGLVWAIFPSLGHLGEFNLLRMMSLLILTALMFSTYLWLRLHRIDSSVATLAAILIGLSPPFMVYVAYLSTLPAVLAALLAVGGAFLARLSETAKSTTKWLLIAGTILLLIASLCLYQVATLYYLAMASVTVLMADPLTSFRCTGRTLVYRIGVLAFAIGIYYLAWRLGLSFRGVATFGKYDPRVFALDIPERVTWFWTGPLAEASSLWLINPKPLVGWLVAALVSIGLCSDVARLPARGLRSRWLVRWVAKCLILICFVPAVFAFILADSAPSTEYRTYAGLESLFILFAVVGMWRSTTRWPKLSGMMVTGWGLLAVAGLFVANDNLTSYFVVPDSLEVRFIRNQFIRDEQAAGHTFAGVHLVRLPRPVAPATRNEIGEPSAVFGPNIGPMVRAALNGLAPDDLQVAYSDRADDPRWEQMGTTLRGMSLESKEIPADPSWALIDMSALTSDARLDED